MTAIDVLDCLVQWILPVNSRPKFRKYTIGCSLRGRFRHPFLCLLVWCCFGFHRRLLQRTFHRSICGKGLSILFDTAIAFVVDLSFALVRSSSSLFNLCCWCRLAVFRCYSVRLVCISRNSSWDVISNKYLQFSPHLLLLVDALDW